MIANAISGLPTSQKEMTMFPKPSRRVFPSLVLLIVPLLLIPLLLNPASAAPDDLAPAYFSAQAIIDSASAGAGTFGVLRVNCPAGMVAVSGGVDLANVLTMVVSSSAPVYDNERLILQADGSAPAPTGWQATAINEAAVAQDFRVGVICVDEAVGLSSEIDSATVGNGFFNVANADCPVGTMAVGGGIDLGQVLQMRVSSSAPLFPGAANNRLFQRDDGVDVAPTGWQATAINDSTTDYEMKVAAICAPEAAGALTIITSDTLSGGFGLARSVCPAGMVAVGGGVDLENVLTMDVSASGMTFTGATARLYQQADGVQGLPAGWQGTARGANGRTVRTGVICLHLFQSYIPAVLLSE